MNFNDPTRWYVVANRVHAAFYVDTSERTFQPILHLFDQKARMGEGDLDTDAPGTGVSSGAGSMHHSLDRRFHTRDQLSLKFSRRVAEYLELMKLENRFDEIVLVCEPKFLGLLKSHFSKKILDLIVAELPREFVSRSDSDLRTAIFSGLNQQRKRKEKSYELRNSISL